MQIVKMQGRLHSCYNSMNTVENEVAYDDYIIEVSK